jgi:hypothetical protein
MAPSPPSPIQATDNNPGYPEHFLNLLSALANLVLLGIRRGAGNQALGIAAKDLGEANLGVDFLDALKVGLRCALGAEEHVLHQHVSAVHHHNTLLQEQLTISSKVNRFVSGTKNHTNAAPRYVSTPKMM